MTEEKKINIDHAEEQVRAAEEQKAEATEDREKGAESTDCSEQANTSGNPSEARCTPCCYRNRRYLMS